MIVRTWHGCVPVKHAEGFANHLQKTGVEHSERTPGNLGTYVRRETQGDWEHFFLATYWKDLEAVKAFAGEQYQIAITYPMTSNFSCYPILTSSSITSKPYPLYSNLLADAMRRPLPFWGSPVLISYITVWVPTVDMNVRFWHKADNCEGPL